jgi:hypothetical protein
VLRKGECEGMKKKITKVIKKNERIDNIFLEMDEENEESMGRR